MLGPWGFLCSGCLLAVCWFVGSMRVWGVSTMLRDLSFTERHYRQDLGRYLALVSELNNCVMSPARREELEWSKVVLEVVLDMYEVDYR